MMLVLPNLFKNNTCTFKQAPQHLHPGNSAKPWCIWCCQVYIKASINWHFVVYSYSLKLWKMSFHCWIFPVQSI